jgi:hypothetical protein
VVIGPKQQEQVLHTGLQDSKISFILTESSIENTLNYDIKVRLTVLFVVPVLGLLKIQQIRKWKEKKQEN